jgi:hypothetical protein
MVYEIFSVLDKPLFRMPRWLKPELNRPIYYVHVAIIIAVIYALMQYAYNPGGNVLIYGLYLIIADGVAHTVLGMD